MSDKFRLTKMRFKSDDPTEKLKREINSRNTKWFQWPNCQSLIVSEFDCQNGAECELHAPSTDRDGAWCILYLCRICLSRYAKDNNKYIIKHQITNEVLLYEAVNHDEVPF